VLPGLKKSQFSPHNGTFRLNCYDIDTLVQLTGTDIRDFAVPDRMCNKPVPLNAAQGYPVVAAASAIAGKITHPSDL